MALAAQRTGKLLNQADLARDAALSHPTAHRYLNLLETGCLITRIRPWTTNPASAIVKAPKLLWSDCGRPLARRHSVAGGRGQAAQFWLLAGANDLPDSPVLARPGPGQSAASLLARPSRPRGGIILEQNGKLVAIEIVGQSGKPVRCFQHSDAQKRSQEEPPFGARRCVACRQGQTVGPGSLCPSVGLDGEGVRRRGPGSRQTGHVQRRACRGPRAGAPGPPASS